MEQPNIVGQHGDRIASRINCYENRCHPPPPFEHRFGQAHPSQPPYYRARSGRYPGRRCNRKRSANRSRRIDPMSRRGRPDLSGRRDRRRKSFGNLHRCPRPDRRRAGRRQHSAPVGRPHNHRPARVARQSARTRTSIKRIRFVAVGDSRRQYDISESPMQTTKLTRQISSRRHNTRHKTLIPNLAKIDIWDKS